MLAAALTVIGIAGALITPVIPSLLGFGVALLAIGAGLALAGAGIFLIATGLSALVVAAPTGVGVIVAAFVTLQKGIIENAKLLILGLLEVVKAFADTAPQFVDAVVKILNSRYRCDYPDNAEGRRVDECVDQYSIEVLADESGKNHSSRIRSSACTSSGDQEQRSCSDHSYY